MKHHAENIRVQKFILLVAVALFAIKMSAWWLTGSVAILTDGLESIVNVVSGLIGLYSLQLAAKPRDKSHPYGHGKVEFISAGIEGTLITLAGLYIIYEGVMGIIDPVQLQSLDLGISIIALSAVLNFLMGSWAVKTGKRNNSLALQASGRHLQSDTYTTIGIIIGLVALRITGYAWLDGAIAIFFALLIIHMGAKILRHAVAGIMDESDEQLLQEMVSYLQEHRQSQWVDVHNLRIVKYGSVLHIDVHLTLPWYFTVKQGHDETDKLEELILDKFGQRIELNIHTDFCQAYQCKLCNLENCPERQFPFEKQVEWTVNKVVSSDKHALK